MESSGDLSYVSAQAIAAPIISFLALLLCIPPLVWHSSNRNLAASFLTAFVIICDLLNIINAIIWPTDDVNSWWNGSILCDIQVKLNIGIQVGMPGALVCIFRNLALVMDTENTVLVPSKTQRLRAVAIELFFCAGIPVLAMVAHFIVQPNRYFIIAIAGCSVSYDDSWLAILLSITWPPIICLIAAVYCGMLSPSTSLHTRCIMILLTNDQPSPSRDPFDKIHIRVFEYTGGLREQSDHPAIHQTVLPCSDHDPVRLTSADVRVLHQHPAHAPTPAVFVEQHTRSSIWRDH